MPRKPRRKRVTKAQLTATKEFDPTAPVMTEKKEVMGDDLLSQLKASGLEDLLTTNSSSVVPAGPPTTQEGDDMAEFDELMKEDGEDEEDEKEEELEGIKDEYVEDELEDRNGSKLCVGVGGGVNNDVGGIGDDCD